MNNAMAILAHALRMLIHEPGTTLRVITPALLIVLASVVAAVVLVPDTLTALQSTPETFVAPSPSSIMLMLLIAAAGLVGYALMAILWHRHVLLNGTEARDILRPGSAIILGYLWRAIILALVQFLIAIPIAIAIAIIGGIGSALTGAAVAFFVIGILAGILFVWIALRLSVVLPAAALGNSMRIKESWEVTAPIAKTLWSLAVLLAMLNVAISLITVVILPDSAVIAMGLQTMVYIVEGLVFISVLTTLYGHLVEGRSLG
ncbi:MAG: hypothetical protein ACSHWS_10095 [Sulfitobacter sp.]